MPPYLGESLESVMAFLQKVDLEQFDDPTQLDDILCYVVGSARAIQRQRRQLISPFTT